MQLNKIHLISFLGVMTILLSKSSVVLPQQLGTGILNIDSSPSGAAVYVDSRMRGTTPVLLEVQAQPHVIEVRHKGYESHTASITVNKDKVIRTKIELKKKMPPKPAAARTANSSQSIRVKNDIQVHVENSEGEPGTVFLDTTPKSLTASINGFPISKVTPVAFDIRPGIYELRLTNENKDVVYQKTIFVRSGKTLAMDIVIQKKRTIDYTDPWK